MRINHLTYLIDLAQSRSINHTAKHFFMSQQGLSQTLKRLENDLGVPLFVRSKTGVNLTKEGKTVVEYGQKILTLYDEMQEKIQPICPAVKNSPRQSLTIASYAMILSAVLPTIVDEFCAKFPDIRIQFKELDVADAVTSVQNSSSNVAIVSLPTAELDDDFRLDMNILFRQPKIRMEKLASFHILACVSQDNPLLEKPFLAKDTLSQLPLILYHPLYHTPAITQFYNNDNVVCISNNIDIHTRLISQGSAISLVPDFTYELMFKSAGVAFVPLEDTINSASIYSITPAHNTPSFVDDFLTIVKAHLAKIALKN